MLPDGVVVWSLWPGYLRTEWDAEAPPSTRPACPSSSTTLRDTRSVTDLQLLATALHPGKVVPIHTEAGDRFDEYFADVEAHPDGEWWEV